MKFESVQELFSQAAGKFKDNVAIERLPDRLTYGELEESSNRLANYLISIGVAKGSIVAILADDSIEVTTAIIATLKAGCVFLPLDPGIPEKRLQVIVSKASPTVFLVQTKYLETLKQIIVSEAPSYRFVSIDRVADDHLAAGSEDVESYLKHEETGKPSVEYGPDDFCYLYFTSGSTGIPKAIAGRLKGIDHFIRWEIENFGVQAGTRVSQLTGPSFDAFLRDIFTPLCAGGTVCVPPSRELILDAAKLVQWIDEQQINLVHCVPSLFRSMINQALTADKFASLKFVLMAGEALLPADIKKWMNVFGERVQLVNLYGPTETTMTKFFYFVQPADKDRRFIPIGKPMSGARALVLDPKGKACPPGAIGEIFIRTPFMTHGYYQQPELTKEVFVPNPFSTDPNDLIYKTGDLGRLLDDGNFEFVGRKDQQVKIRGVRIEIGEIENALREHESIRDVVVVDLADADGNKYLCAYVVFRNAVEIEELRNFLINSLPLYMVPSAFVVREELPRTLNGKINRKALPTPNEARLEAGAKVDTPRTPIEDLLVGIWSSVLGFQSVGINDNFFALGGHSLMATQLLARVRESLDIELPLRSLFDAPTVAGQARYIETARLEEKGIGTAPLVPVTREVDIPLSFSQQHLWFIDQLEPGSIFYNISTSVRLQGKLDLPAFEKALEEVCRRHEVLRTSFETVEGKPFQVIAPPGGFRLALLDISDLEIQSREAELARLVNAEPGRPFDLSQGPLMRATLVKFDEETHVVLFTIHHIICDGLSMPILIREVGILYEAFVNDRPSPLPELKIQYADFAHWQHQMLDERLEDLLGYWRTQLAGASYTLDFPFSKPRPQVQSFRGAALMRHLPDSLATTLKTFSRHEGVTLFMTLLAAFEILLFKYTGQEDFVLGSPLASRNRVELENLIGLFPNTLVLRSDLSGNPTYREVLARVREVTLNAYSHHDLPFGKLVEELRPERNLSHNPLFQVAFTIDTPVKETITLPGLTLNSLGAGTNTVQLDLIMHMVETEQGLSSSLQYSTDLFDESSIIKMLDDFQSLLEQIASNPNLTLQELTEALSAVDKQLMAAKEKEVDEIGLQKLRQVKRKSIASYV
jgi:amino acid adenylation domain-containing protein